MDRKPETDLHPDTQLELANFRAKLMHRPADVTDELCEVYRQLAKANQRAARYEAALINIVDFVSVPDLNEMTKPGELRQTVQAIQRTAQYGLR